MRFTLSALSLAETTGRSFSYAWPQSDLFRPPLTDLWEFEHAETSWEQSGELAKTYPHVEKAEDLDPNNPVWHLRSGNVLTLPDGAAPWSEKFRELTPTPAIQRRVTELHAEHLKGSPYVGVMIRAHEKSPAKTIEASPVEWYLERMAEMDAANPGTRFFLSCDVPEVQDRVIAAFPGSVGQADKGGYNTAEGVASGVVDLYLLAASSYMLVPYWSSFPNMAFELADRKIAMENSRKGKRDVNVSAVPLAADPLRPAVRD